MSLFNHSTFLKRMWTLREKEINLNGSILCLGGGSVRVHLLFLAASNEYLYQQVTNIFESGKTVLFAPNVSQTGVEHLMDYCYSGEAKFNPSNLTDFLEAAIAFEFKELVEFAIAYISIAHKKSAPDESLETMWGNCLDALLKYADHKFETLPHTFIPNLIARNIGAFPRSVVLNRMKWPAADCVLSLGQFPSDKRVYAVNLFLAVCVKDKMGSNMSLDTINSLRAIADQIPDDTQESVGLPDTVPECILISILEKAVDTEFPALVSACMGEAMKWPPSSIVLEQVVALTKAKEDTPDASLLEYIMYCMARLPPSISSGSLCYLLQSDWLQMDEHLIFKAALSWCIENQVDVANKASVISLVRFGLMTREQLDGIIAAYTDVQLRGCGDVLMTAMQYHLKSYAQPLHGGPSSQPRATHPAVYIMGGRDVQSTRRWEVLRWAISDGGASPAGVSQVSVTPAVFDNAASAVVGRFVFVCGGEESDGGGGSVDGAWRFDTLHRSWLQLAPLAVPRQEHTCTPAQRCLAVVGGFSSKMAELASVEIYDIAANSWQSGPALPGPSSQHAACAMDDVIYISGGTSGMSLQRLRPSARASWEGLAPLLFCRQTHAMVAAAGRLYVAGGSAVEETGWVDQLSGECYDVTTDQWSLIAPPKLPCSFALSVHQEGKVYVLGGMGGTPMQDIQVYTVEDNTWSLSALTLPDGLANMAGGIVAL